MKWQRQRDLGEATFPLILVGAIVTSPQESAPIFDVWFDVWFEDYDNNVIICLNNCQGGFSIKRFASKCAKQLRQGPVVTSQRDEEAVWNMVSHGVPHVVHSLTSMEIDTVY